MNKHVAVIWSFCVGIAVGFIVMMLSGVFYDIFIRPMVIKNDSLRFLMDFPIYPSVAVIIYFLFVKKWVMAAGALFGIALIIFILAPLSM
jgi:hypothetical protein